MSLVFGSLLLFILISPGLIFRFSYLQGTYAKLTFKVSAVEEIFWALVPAFFLQMLAIELIALTTSYHIRLDIVYQLINGDGGVDFRLVEQNLGPFMAYMIVINLVAIVLGVMVREAVRKYKLDLRFRFLRLGNEWHYLFSGEILYPGRKTAPESIFMIQIDVVVNSSEGDIIYCGTLEDFYLSKDNGLDRIYLRNVYRRNLKDDLDLGQPNVGYLKRYEDERYYAMPGDLFVVTYDKIVNLNVTYITLEETVRKFDWDESGAE